MSDVQTTTDQSRQADEAGAGPEPTPPAIRVVRGAPTPEELTALVAVLAAAGGGEDPDPGPRHTSSWASHERAVRAPTAAGPGGWRASALPRT